MINITKLIIAETPLQILPNLAKSVGLNEAIVLQQIHYWLQQSKHEIDGRKWVYNSYEEWQEQFPFWSTKTIYRAFRSLEKQGLIEAKVFNAKKLDKTKWYTINYEAVSCGQIVLPCGQLDQTMRTDCPNHTDNLSKPIPENTTENTTENGYISPQADKMSTCFDTFWQEYPLKVKKVPAFSAYKNAVKGNNHDDILLAARHYAEECASLKREKQFILHPTTFLNKERWKDYTHGPVASRASPKPKGFAGIEAFLAEAESEENCNDP